MNRAAITEACRWQYEYINRIRDRLGLLPAEGGGEDPIAVLLWQRLALEEIDVVLGMVLPEVPEE